MILYLLSADTQKADKAEAILEAGGVVSVQVLNEITSVCHKKIKMAWPEIEAVLQAVKASVNIVPLTEQTHAHAIEICKRYQLSFYDAHICSAAISAGATELISEDMQDGLEVEGLKVKNPFR